MRPLIVVICTNAGGGMLWREGGNPFPPCVTQPPVHPLLDGTSSGFLEKLKMKSAALLACADAMKINRGSFFIACSQFAT